MHLCLEGSHTIIANILNSYNAGGCSTVYGEHDEGLNTRGSPSKPREGNILRALRRIASAGNNQINNVPIPLFHAGNYL